MRETEHIYACRQRQYSAYVGDHRMEAISRREDEEAKKNERE